MKIIEARVRELYASLGELQQYDAQHHITRRMGYKSPEEMWAANPTLTMTEGDLGLLREATVRELYSSLQDLKRADATHGVARRLGYKTAEDMWEDNPVVQDRPAVSWANVGEAKKPFDFERYREKLRRKREGLPTETAKERAEREVKNPPGRTPEQEAARAIRTARNHPEGAPEPPAPQRRRWTPEEERMRRMRFEDESIPEGARGTVDQMLGEDFGMRDDFGSQPARARHRHTVQMGKTTDDYGEPVGSEGMRRFATCEPGQGGGDPPGCANPQSTSAILLGRRGYAQWARDMRERGEAVPSWDAGAVYDSQAEDPTSIVDRLLEGEKPFPEPNKPKLRRYSKEELAAQAKKGTKDDGERSGGYKIGDKRGPLGRFGKVKEDDGPVRDPYMGPDAGGGGDGPSHPGEWGDPPRMTHGGWQQEFPDYTEEDIPPQILQGIASGALVDLSWAEDAGPSFALASAWKPDTRTAAFDHDESVATLHVQKGGGMQVVANDLVELETDDIGQALAALRANDSPHPTQGDGKMGMDDAPDASGVVDKLLAGDEGEAESDEVNATCPDGGEHQWTVVNDSFAHEFGSQRIPPHWECVKCGETTNENPGPDEEPDEPDPDRDVDWD